MLIAKTLKAFTPKFDLIKNTNFKNRFKTIFVTERSRFISAIPEKISLALKDRLTQKITEKFLRWNQLQILMKYCWKS